MTVTAVLDIGKTNVKLYAVGPDGVPLETLSTPNASLDGPPWRHHDLAGIEAWLLAALTDLASRHDIDAIE
ncbi:carbohydrate kinase, partial [Amaricoccus sp. HAR-UPW-R2A-40]